MSAGRQSGQRIRGYQRQHLNILGLQGDTQLCSLSLAHTHTPTHIHLIQFTQLFISLLHYPPHKFNPFCFLIPQTHTSLIPHSWPSHPTGHVFTLGIWFTLSPTHTHTHRIRTPASWCNTVGIQRRGGGLNTSSRCYEEGLHTHQRGVT